MKDPKLRAAEFDNAGLPYPYVVYEALVESPREVEQKAHRSLKASLENREWFRCEPHVAIAALRAAAGQPMFERAEEGAARPPAAEATPPKPRYRDPSRFDRARAALRAEWERHPNHRPRALRRGASLQPPFWRRGLCEPSRPRRGGF